MEQTNSFDTIEQKQALDLVANTNVSFFLTGKAGTGKTTFVHYILDNVKKNFLVDKRSIRLLVSHWMLLVLQQGLTSIPRR